MIKERAKELSDVLKAYSEGKTIQMNTLYGWKDINPIIIEELIQASMLFPDTKCLRIKPEKKLVPFTFEDNLLFRDKWIIEKIDRNFIGKITGFTNSQIQTTMQCVGYITLFKEYEFEDGSPCGKYINE